jgi:hypothetical protein
VSPASGRFGANASPASGRFGANGIQAGGRIGTNQAQLGDGPLVIRRPLLSLAEFAPDVWWVIDVETSRFVYVSPSVEQLRGFYANEVLLQDLTAA